MARGRMLNKKVCRSLKFQKLPDDTCRLFATWMISHLDARGVFHAEPGLLKATVFPRRDDVSVEDVERYLSIMSSPEVGLIVLFEARGESWQYWPGFTDEQIGLRPERERIDLPKPPELVRNDSGTDPDTIRNDSGTIPAQEKGREEKRKGREEKSAPAREKDDVCPDCMKPRSTGPLAKKQGDCCSCAQKAEIAAFLGPSEKPEEAPEAPKHWAEGLKDRPWLGWEADRVSPRQKASRETVQRVCWMVENRTGLRAPDEKKAFSAWLGAAKDVYLAAGGDWKVVERTIDVVWEREEKYRPGHMRGFVDEARKQAAMGRKDERGEPDVEQREKDLELLRRRRASR